MIHCQKTKGIYIAVATQFVSYVPFTDNPILCTKLPSQEVFAFLSFTDNAVDVVKQTNYYPQEVIEIWNIPEGGSMGMWKVFLRQYFDSLMLR